MTYSLFDPEVWKDAWINDPEAGVNRMLRAGMEPAHTFNDETKANTFHKQSFSEEGRKRTTRIMGWLQTQGVSFENASVLDIGAASGGFSIPFAEQGANVTAVEPSFPLTALMKKSILPSLKGSVEIVREQFEELSIEKMGWQGKFDLVFASMCPAIFGWEMVEKALNCASRFCYISTVAGPKEHNLIEELRPVIGVKGDPVKTSDMAYIIQLLNIYGFSFQTLITRETQTVMMSVEEAVKHTLSWFSFFGMPTDEKSLQEAEAYLRKTYAGKMVSVQQGGRFGKVLVRVKDQNMF
ncbi:class I SAM-dependent methyltransferase [Paenibacillus dokdonensis]|uniref:Class I SAM-dependent methyltransferase n=1 Tax=Paenibacillus dokdonensis TaxID=2567944 RepID=A0ABU6GNY1_9BACL|nr:class I SAM-dependent methyltransferase [Paenibacillus dokdonensis]MEC0239857.1 class I SAM-dependent methyltransferase [Paenibacillus dokdonensis]